MQLTTVSWCIYASLISGLVGWPLDNGQAQSVNRQNDFFQARQILALSDADMVPSAYVDGQLGPVWGADALSVLSFDGRQAEPSHLAQLPISNSVTGPPAAMATTPDGRYAITIETRGKRPPSGKDVKLTNLPQGRIITVIDLTNPKRPRPVQRLVGPARALSVSISADGQLVVLAVHPDGDGRTAPLWLYRLKAGRLTDGRAQPVPGWQAGDELVHALFHPTRPVLALTNATTHQVRLFTLQPSGSAWQLRPWGNPVGLEPGILLTCFSPDGRYFFANGSPAGVDPKVPQPGVVLSVRLSAQTDTSAEARHELVSRAHTGHLPEGLAISPDGQVLITVNLENTYLPVGSPERGRFASLSLVTVDPATGVLTSAGNYLFDGLLPESAVFDRSSRRLAVANYGRLDNLRADGSIDFWRIISDPQEPKHWRLVKTGYSVLIQRGVHTLAIIR